MPEHVKFDLPCRPGITGMATTVFAREEKILACIPKDQVETFFHSVVLPAKRRLDAEYMARATFRSDLRILVNTVLRRWDTAALDKFIESTAFALKLEAAQGRAAETSYVMRRAHKPLRVHGELDKEEISVI
jgi:hypothetical protein